MSGPSLSTSERRFLAAWRALRRDLSSGRETGIDATEERLLATWRGWHEHPCTRPLWAAALRDQLAPSEPPPGCPSGLFGPSGPLPGASARLLGMLVGGAVGEAVARERSAALDRTSAILSVLDGLVRTHVALRTGGHDDPISGTLDGLRRWLHAHGVPWSDCTAADTREAVDSPTSAASELGTLGDGDPALLTALARIASGEPPGTPRHPTTRSNSASATSIGALAAFWSSDPSRACALGTDFAALTHGDPDGHLPAGCVAATVSALLHDEALGDAITSAMSTADLEGGTPVLAEAVRLSTRRPRGSRPSRTTIEAMSRGTTGAEVLAIAVRAALCCPEDPDGAIRIAADHSGDAVSSAILCGQLLGALHGPTAIATGPLHTSLLRTIERIGADAVAEFGPRPPAADPWFTRYPATPTGFTGGSGETAVADDTATHTARPSFVNSVLGAAIGEALGTPVQAQSWDEIRAQHGDRGLGDYVPAGHPSGRIGSDTQLLLFTVEGMIRADISRRSHGTEDPTPHVQHAYQRWLHTQHLSWPRAAGAFLAHTPHPDGWLVEQRALFQIRAPGRTMMRTLIAFAKGQQEMGRPDNPVSRSRGSAALTRAVGAALWNDEPRRAFRTGAATAALTHGNPEAYLASGALSVLVAGVVHGQSLPDAARMALRELARYPEHEEVSRRIETALHLGSSEREVPAPADIERELGTGWTAAEALGIGLCAALAAGADFDLGMRVAVSHSGNSATCAAVCGGLLGALVGPAERWVDELELAELVERLAQDAVHQFGPHPPGETSWSHRYPPT